MQLTGQKLTDEYYNGPLVGYTNEEMANIIGKAVLEVVDKQGMQIVWSKTH